jgi:hypothetical protein
MNCMKITNANRAGLPIGCPKQGKGSSKRSSSNIGPIHLANEIDVPFGKHRFRNRLCFCGNRQDTIGFQQVPLTLLLICLPFQYAAVIRFLPHALGLRQQNHRFSVFIWYPSAADRML